MNENFKRKEELATKLGMELSEAFELFSEASLTSMELGEIVGGNDGFYLICPTVNIGKCSEDCRSSHSNNCAACATVVVPSMLPTLPLMTVSPS